MVGIEAEFEGVISDTPKLRHAANRVPYAVFEVKVPSREHAAPGEYTRVTVSLFAKNVELMVGSTLVQGARVWIRGRLTLGVDLTKPLGCRLYTTSRDVRFPRG